MFFNSKNSREFQTFSLMEEHAKLISKALYQFFETVKCFIEGNGDYCKEGYQVHLIEHDADKIQMKILQKLFEGAFFANIRNDLAELVFTMDDIAGCAVNITHQLSEEKPEFPSNIKQIFLDICEETKKISPELIQAIHTLKTDLEDSKQYCMKIRDIEKDIDSKQHQSIKLIFESDIELAQKLQLKNLFIEAAKISDRAEDIADKINILAMSMKI